MRRTIEIDDKLEPAFQKKAVQKYGLKRGSISKAINEAIKEWVKK